MVGRLEEIDGFLVSLPYVEVVVDHETMPNNGFDKKPDGASSLYAPVVLRIADRVASPAFWCEESLRGRVLNILKIRCG